MRKIIFRGLPESGQVTLADLDLNHIRHERGFLIGSLVTDFKDEAAITGDLIDCDEDCITPSWWWTVRPKTVGEWTGLKDISGKLIWEDDILKFDLPFSQNRLGVVVRQDNQWIVLSRSNCLDNFDILQNITIYGDRFHNETLVKVATEAYAEKIVRGWWKGGRENDK